MLLIAVLEKTLESLFNCKEIKPVNSKWNQPWMFIGRTDGEAEPPILWPPDMKSWLIGKDPDAGKDWRQEEKGMTGWDGWMASPTQWTWVWVNSGSWWWTGKPDVLQSTGLQSWTRLSDWTTATLQWFTLHNWGDHWVCLLGQASPGLPQHHLNIESLPTGTGPHHSGLGRMSYSAVEADAPHKDGRLVPSSWTFCWAGKALNCLQLLSTCPCSLRHLGFPAGQMERLVCPPDWLILLTGGRSRGCKEPAAKLGFSDVNKTEAEGCSHLVLHNLSLF